MEIYINESEKLALLWMLAASIQLWIAPTPQLVLFPLVSFVLVMLAPHFGVPLFSQLKDLYDYILKKEEENKPQWLRREKIVYLSHNPSTDPGLVYYFAFSTLFWLAQTLQQAASLPHLVALAASAISLALSGGEKIKQKTSDIWEAAQENPYKTIAFATAAILTIIVTYYVFLD